jgi:hypothetical protein
VPYNLSLPEDGDKIKDRNVKNEIIKMKICIQTSNHLSICYRELDCDKKQDSTKHRHIL